MNDENENVVIKEENNNENSNSSLNENEDELNNQAFEDDADSEENPNEDIVESNDKKQPEQPSKKELTREERARYAELRRAAEQKERIENDAYEKGLVDAVNGVNPYTNEPIQTKADIEEFRNMREAAKLGYDPVADYSKFLKEKQNRQNAIQSNTFDFKLDKEEFEKSYPDIDINALVSDDEFKDFADGLVGIIPLKDIYGKYQKTQAKVEQSIQKRVLKEMSKGKSSPGSLINTQIKKQKRFEDMNDDEFEEAIQKAKSGDYLTN